MIPFILAAIGGAIIGNALRSDTQKFDSGGSVPNYEGKSAEQIWDLWTVEQREHFIVDHFDNKALESDWQNKSLDDLPSNVRVNVEIHLMQGQYKKGGKIPEYKIFEGHDHFKNKSVYRVMGMDNDYVGDWHKDISDAEKELSELCKECEHNKMANLVVKDWLSEKIKDWYIKTYPKDDLGEELNDDVTFNDLWNGIHKKEDVYEIMGVDDSIIRERLFEHLSEIKGVDYDYIYKKWLDSDYADGGDLPMSNHQMKNYVIEKTGISSGTMVNGKYYETWDEIANDLGYRKDDNGWVKTFPSRFFGKGGDVSKFRYKKGDIVYAFQHAYVTSKYTVGDSVRTNLQHWAKVEILEQWSDEPQNILYKAKLIEGENTLAKKDETLVVMQNQLSKQNKKPVSLGYDNHDEVYAKGGLLKFTDEIKLLLNKVEKSDTYRHLKSGAKKVAAESKVVAKKVAAKSKVIAHDTAVGLSKKSAAIAKKLEDKNVHKGKK